MRVFLVRVCVFFLSFSCRCLRTRLPPGLRHRVCFSFLFSPRAPAAARHEALQSASVTRPLSVMLDHTRCSRCASRRAAVRRLDRVCDICIHCLAKYLRASVCFARICGVSERCESRARWLVLKDRCEAASRRLNGERASGGRSQMEGSSVAVAVV